MKIQQKPDYANWLPLKFLIFLGVLSSIFGVLVGLSLLILLGVALKTITPVMLAGIAFMLLFFGYMAYIRRLFS